MRFRIPDPKADARHQERVAEARRKIREKKQAREERRAARQSASGTVNLNTLAYRLMMHIDPGARPTPEVGRRQSLFDAIRQAKGPVTYVGREVAYVALVPPPMKYEVGAPIRLLIVRGPKPFVRATATVILGEGGYTDDVQLPGEADWVETECGDGIADYALEIAAYDRSRQAAITDEPESTSHAAPDNDAEREWAGYFRKALAAHLTELGLNSYTAVFTSPETLPSPSGQFNCRITVENAEDLVIECKYAGGGLITFPLGSRRARFRANAEPRFLEEIEFVEGTPEGDARWDELHGLALERRAGLDEQLWRRRVGETLGLDVAVSPEADAISRRIREALKAVGFDQEGLASIRIEIESAQLPNFLREELLRELNERLQ